MAAPLITVTNTSDVAKAGAVTAVGKTAPAANSAETEERVWNDLAGSGTDTAKDFVLVALARISGDSEWLESGVDLLDRRGLQIQITKKNSVAVSDRWVSIGTGVSITLPDLPAGEYHQYKFRVSPPVGASEVVTEFKIAAGFRKYFPVANPNVAPRGVVRGAGGGAVTAILSRSIAIAVSGTDTFEWPDYSWYYEGVPLSVLDHDETISNADSAAAALGAGESYIFLAVLDGTTTTIVKGEKATGADYPSNAPAAPAGNRILGWGERFADADGTSMTFTTLDESPDFLNITTSGLTATVARARGPALVDGVLIDGSTSTDANLTASSTNTVQLLADGSIGVTLDGSASEVGAEILADIVTDGSGETSRVERRRWVGGEVIQFQYHSSPTGSPRRIYINPHDRPLRIRPDTLKIQLDAVPGAGNVKADIFTRPDGGPATTIFTSSGSDDRRPVVTNGDSTAINYGLPEVLEIAVGGSLECVLTFTAAAPLWAVVSLVADQG